MWLKITTTTTRTTTLLKLIKPWCQSNKNFINFFFKFYGREKFYLFSHVLFYHTPFEKNGFFTFESLKYWQYFTDMCYRYFVLFHFPLSVMKIRFKFMNCQCYFLLIYNDCILFSASNFTISSQLYLNFLWICSMSLLTNKKKKFTMINCNTIVTR